MSLYDALFHPAPELDRVLDGVPVFIGNEDARAAGVLGQHGITHVLCLQTRWERDAYPEALAALPAGVTEKWYDIGDAHEEATRLDEVLLLCVDFIDSALRESPAHAVLVHCAMGVSRSAAVVVAWLMAARGYTTAEAALAQLRAARPVARPNPAFMALLRTFSPEQQ